MRALLIKDICAPYLEQIQTWFKEMYGIGVSKRDVIRFTIRTSVDIYMNETATFFDAKRFPRLKALPGKRYQLDNETIEMFDEVHRRFTHKICKVPRYYLLMALIKERAVTLPKPLPFRKRLVYLYGTPQPKTMLDLTSKIAERYNK